MASYNSINPEGQKGLRTYIDGKADGPTIVFVHGWPDDHALWDKQVMQKSPHIPGRHLKRLPLSTLCLDQATKCWCC